MNDPLSATDRQELIDVARAAIEAGLQGASTPPAPDPATCSVALQQPRATFVTLQIKGALRGCIGTLSARQPLVEDVAEHAFAAAFHDPRFAPLTAAEWRQCDFSVSVLSEPEPLDVADEVDLQRRLRPGIDGLMLTDGKQSATFLPAVWADLSTPAAFVRALKQKAGWSATYWTPTLRCARYQVESIPASG